MWLHERVVDRVQVVSAPVTVEGGVASYDVDNNYNDWNWRLTMFVVANRGQVYVWGYGILGKLIMTDNYDDW